VAYREIMCLSAFNRAFGPAHLPDGNLGIPASRWCSSGSGIRFGKSRALGKAKGTLYKEGSRRFVGTEGPLEIRQHRHGRNLGMFFFAPRSIRAVRLRRNQLFRTRYGLVRRISFLAWRSSDRSTLHKSRPVLPGKMGAAVSRCFNAAFYRALPLYPDPQTTRERWAPMMKFGLPRLWGTKGLILRDEGARDFESVECFPPGHAEKFESQPSPNTEKRDRGELDPRRRPP